MKNANKREASGGGSATNAGVEYQAGVTAWLAVLALAGDAASPPFNLPETERVTVIRLESKEPVDDIAVETSGHHSIFIQAKRGIDLSALDDSDFGKTMTQFIGQYVRRTDAGLFDEHKDAYVLAVGDTSSSQVSKVAASALDKLHAGANPETLNASEKKAYRTIVDHLKRAWRQNKGSEIDDARLTKLLKVIYIQEVDVIGNGTDAQRAKDSLRRAILDQPEQAGAAWNTLVADSLSLARQKGGATYASLEKLLRDKAIGLKSPIAFDKDIAQLQVYSERTMRSLSRAASIPLSGKEIKVARSVVDELYRLAKAGQSFVVVGEPGAGKSGALYETFERLRRDGCDIVAIATEKVEATSLGSLRNELSLAHELGDVLANWNGPERGIVVIDALDAARDPRAADLFLDVVRLVLDSPGTRWSVVISIRKYDLRYNNKVKRLFPQGPITSFIDPEFSVAHVNVPLFDDTEIDQIKTQSPELKALVDTAAGKLGDLLRSPFNLSIAADIMAQGVTAHDLSQVRSQLELLDQYWNVRVTDAADKQGDARNALLATALGIMVEQQSLTITRQELVGKQLGLSGQLDQLLSRNVLVEDTTTHRLSFYHHILYDYGIYRSVLRSSANNLADLLKRTPYLALSIRPSIQMYWQYMWQQDPSRTAYWEEVIKLDADPDFPKLAKVFGADFAVSAVREEADLRPLLAAVMGTDQRLSRQAQAVVQRCSIAMDAAKRRQQDDGARHWIMLVEQALSKFTEQPLRSRLCAILESAVEGPALTPDQYQAAGGAARRLLEIELAQDPPNTWIARVAVKLVAVTYDTNPSATSLALDKLLDDALIAKYGYMYLGHFADNAGILADRDPTLVERLYDKAFAYEETVDATTYVSPSQILGMTSTRKQDYAMVLYQLGRAYAAVIEKDLALGLRILHGVLAQRAAAGVLPPPKPPQVAEFDYEGVTAGLVAGDRYPWDDELSPGDDAAETLQAFRAAMAQLAQQPDGADRLLTALKEAAPYTQAAPFWRVMLQTATNHSETLGVALTPLLRAVPLLASDETADLASEFMAKVYPQLSGDERATSEASIMRIPTMATDAEGMKRLEGTRDNFIRALDAALIATEAVKQRRAELDERGVADGVTPTRRARGGWVHDLDDDELDRMLGRTPNPHTKALNELSQQARTQLGALTASNLTQPGAGQVLDLIAELKAALAAHAPADQERQDTVNNEIISASSLLVCSPLFTADSPEWPQLRQDIVAGTGLGAPVVGNEADDDIADGGVVHATGLRITAAQALMAVVSKENDTAQLLTLQELIRALARDTAAPVRMSVAGNVHLLAKDPAFAWEIIDHFVEDEADPQVLQGLVNSVGRFRWVEPGRATAAIMSLYSRCKDSGNKSLRQAAAIHVALLYADQGRAEAKQALTELIDHPVERYDELERVIVYLRERLVHGISEPANVAARDQRLRTTQLIQEVLSRLTNGVSAWRLQHGNQPASELTDQDRDELKAYRTNIDNIGMQVYFASGAFDEKNSKGGLSDAAKARFIEEQHALIEQVVATGEVRSAYQFIEMALAYQDIDPIWALKLVETAVAASVAFGAAYESLVASAIATFVKQFIARHRHYLRDKANQASLMNILDAFVDVGWPEAINLTQDLEEIFR